MAKWDDYDEICDCCGRKLIAIGNETFCDYCDAEEWEEIKEGSVTVSGSFTDEL